MVLALLLLVVAAGAPGGGRPPRVGRGSPLAVRAMLDVGVGVVGQVVILLFALAVSGLRIGRKPKDSPEQRVYAAPAVPWALRVVLPVMFLLLALGVIAVIRGADPHKSPARPVPAAPSDLPPDRPDQTPEGSATPDLAVAAVVVVVGLTAASAAVLVQRNRRRRRRDPQAAPPFPHDPIPAVSRDVDVDDLLAEADPRRAVVAAYARMEQVLGATGLTRRPSEAPLEYLAHVQGACPAAGPPATRLTQLFERAKFGAGAVDRTMQSEAVDALRSVLDRLAVPA